MNGHPPWLSLIVLAPWAGALVLALLPRLGGATSRWISLGFSLSTLGLGLAAFPSFDRALPGYQLVERHPWIASLRSEYHLGADGMSVLLVLLTGIVTPAALLASWKQARDPRLFGLLFLFLQGCALGVFLTLDFLPWFLFWELSLVPSYFLIRLWGGAGSGRAALQFVLYTLAGSAFMLLGFAAVYAAAGTLDFELLARIGADGALHAKLAGLGGFWPKAVFLGVFLGLAVKVPLFPFHTWLPPAYSEAPTGTAMFLTGVMSKMGVYGFLRILWPIFPAPLHAAAAPLVWLALGGVVFGAFAAMQQADLKRMVAYSSINHVSYCLLALFAVAAAAPGAGGTNADFSAALSGALLQMFNHGISAAALFFCVSVLESRSGGRRGLDDFGGVRSVAPIFAGLCGIAMFSSLGMPGLNGFVGEFLIFRGVFGLAPWAAAIGCLGLLATALFLLTFWQRVFHGPRRGAAAVGAADAASDSGAAKNSNSTAPNAFADVSGVELVTLVPLAAIMVIAGILPQLLIGIYNPLIVSWANALSPP